MAKTRDADWLSVLWIRDGSNSAMAPRYNTGQRPRFFRFIRYFSPVETRPLGFLRHPKRALWHFLLGDLFVYRHSFSSFQQNGQAFLATVRGRLRIKLCEVEHGAFPAWLRFAILNLLPITSTSFADSVRSGRRTVHNRSCLEAAEKSLAECLFGN